MLKVNNIFYSIQGEGLQIGEPTVFVRFAGCPFRCPYCDEPQALTDKNCKEYDAKTLSKVIVDNLEETKCYNVELTGGSPEAQPQDELYAFCKQLKKAMPNVCLSIQMSGGINLSKKLCNIIDRKKIDYKEPNCNIPFVVGINNLRSVDEIKFVLDVDGSNYDWFKEVVSEFKMSNVAIIVTTKTNSKYPNDLKNINELTIKMLAGDISKHNIHILPRLHQVYWPNVKGV